MGKVFMLIGALYGMFAVILGAFASHGLRDQISERLLAAFKTGVEYQMYHGLALLLVGLLLQTYPEHSPLRWSAGLFVAGVLLFSGSLYGLALTELRWLGPITPIGGSLFILGWGVLVYALISLPAQA